MKSILFYIFSKKCSDRPHTFIPIIEPTVNFKFKLGNSFYSSFAGPCFQADAITIKRFTTTYEGLEISTLSSLSDELSLYQSL